MAAKRKDAIAALDEALAKALCEAGIPTTAVEVEQRMRADGFTSGFDARTASQIRNTVAHQDELARVVQRLMGEANKLLKTKPPVLEWPGYFDFDFRDVYIVAHDLKVITNALAWYEEHKEHAVGDPEPFWALVDLMHTLHHLLPLMFKMSYDRDRMAALRESIFRPTNRESLDACIAKEIPGYLRDHQRERARGNGVRYVARRLYPILKARNLWTESEDALRKRLTRHHAALFGPPL